MSFKSLNKVMLIGNLTRDPQLKYTPNNKAVSSFSVATNRTWINTDTNEKQEQVEYHNIVAWGRLADLSSSMLHKGDKVYIEGRLQTRKWEGEDKVERRTTEIVLESMMLLKATSDSVGTTTAGSTQYSANKSAKKASEPEENEEYDVEDVSDDVPF